MRIDPITLECMRTLIAPLDTDERRATYAARDPRIPRIHLVRDIDRRYRWDLFYAARVHTVLPEGVDDSHIDTALRRIVPVLP